MPQKMDNDIIKNTQKSNEYKKASVNEVTLIKTIIQRLQ